MVGVCLEDIASLHVREVFEVLKTSPNGLTSEEARRRLDIYGPNMLVEKKRISIAYRFFLQFKDLFGILLIFASLLSAFSGMWELSVVILVVVFINAAFSLFQEWRAEKAMETLKSWMPEYAKVIRDGELRRVLVEELVPGDVLILEEGDRVPADARLVEAYDLWTNNVPLTGESEPQPRNAKPARITDLTYLLAPNLVFLGTSIAKGRGKAVVFATGMNSRFGQIAGLALEIEDAPSPLQIEIAYTAKYIFILAIVVGSIFFLVSLIWLRLPIYISIIFMIGVMVACVPEGLQVTVSSALAINVLKMLEENVLVKRLSVVQTLGSVTMICTDKTGTITKGEMTVRKIWVPNMVVEVSGVGYTPIGEFTVNDAPLKIKEAYRIKKLLEISAICNNAKVEPPSDENRSWGIIGDPTDGALLVAALKYGFNVKHMLARKPIIDMIPFDSERKMMTTIHEYDNKVFIYTKGSPGSILPICDRILVDDKVENLANDHLRAIDAEISDFASEGLRIIAIAYNELPDEESFDAKNVEKNMIFVGLAAMKDPPRPEVKEAIRRAKQAGIKIKIITGDYGLTAQAIAQEVGIVESGNYRIINGLDLEEMSDQEIIEEIEKGCEIFALVSPLQKLRIVRVFKQSGEVVAVTGDGVNDAPSLREADVGVAMGVSGTDVAREASDIVLLDDSFASIVKAIECGRSIYDNIRKFITYVFSHNWAELIPFILYVLLDIPLPLLIVQVLAIDLGIDIIPSLALSREPPEADIMREPPRGVKERLFDKTVFFRSLYAGLIIAAGAMFGCLNAWSAGGWHLGMHLDQSSTVYLKGVTMTFAAIVVAQIGNVLGCRTSKTSLFKTSLRSNKWIWIGITAQLFILSLIIYVPFLQNIFSTTALGLREWMFLALLACVIIFAEEVRKRFARSLAK